MVALQLEAAWLKRLTAEDKHRGKPAQYVDQSSAFGSLLVEREDMQQAYDIKAKVRQEPGGTPRQDPEDFKTKLLEVREIQSEDECQVHFSNQPKVSEVESLGKIKMRNHENWWTKLQTTVTLFKNEHEKMKMR